MKPKKEIEDPSYPLNLSIEAPAFPRLGGESSHYELNSRQKIKEYTHILKHTDVGTDLDGFRWALNKATLLLGLDNEQLARLFDVSRPSVIRWKTGSSKPMGVIRKFVKKSLLEEARKRLNEKFIQDNN